MGTAILEPVAEIVPQMSQALDADSRAWLIALRAEGIDRDDAIARLHGLLLRAARFEVGRRGSRCLIFAGESSTRSPTRRRTTRS